VIFGSRTDGLGIFLCKEQKVKTHSTDHRVKEIEVIDFEKIGKGYVTERICFRSGAGRKNVFMTGDTQASVRPKTGSSGSGGVLDVPVAQFLK